MENKRNFLTRGEKQSKTRPSASCWIVSTLVSRYGFFNVTFLKSLDYLNPQHFVIHQVLWIEVV